jgi:uncharacterized protein YecE (DUF72 family)
MPAPAAPVFIGCAGWSLPRASWPGFPAAGTHLERYAARFNAVEVNSSFYRPHRPQTWQRWAQSVPADFRFAVKLPRLVTHELRLRNAEPALAEFLSAVSRLGEKLGVLLVQLPPSFAFEAARTETFLRQLRRHHDGPVAWEPRHASWFGAAATQLLAEFRSARVAADPAPVPGAERPAAWPGLVYLRLHGSPRMYYSAYDEHFLARVAAAIRRRQAQGQPVWCIFDNTAEGAATMNALALQAQLQEEEPAAIADRKNATRGGVFSGAGPLRR